MSKKLICLPAIILLASAALAQGSLTPPGAPGPTMKTLGQIEPRIPIESLPYRITNQGSYYLTANLVLTNGQSGISIEKSEVTLDLGGFAIEGGATSLQGIVLSGALSHVRIFNGVVTGTSVGVDASSSTHVQIDHVQVFSCRGAGFILGNECVIRDSVANQNLGSGIKGGNEMQVESSQANGNAQNGFELGSFASLVKCTANKNNQNGVSAGEKSNLSVIAANDNNQSGVLAGQGSNISDSCAGQNKLDGFNGGVVAVISRCNGTFNSRHGISVAQGGSVSDSGASGNGNLGINGLDRSVIFNCKADGNGGGGISVTISSTVRDCNVQGNLYDGIKVTSECTVLRNHCNRNTRLTAAAGIHATGNGNQIEENSCFSNDRGFGIDVAGNFIFKNTSSNNTLNYYINGDQTMGPIITEFDPTQTFHPLSNFAL